MSNSGRPGEYYCYGHGKWHWVKDHPVPLVQGRRKFCRRGKQLLEERIARNRK